MTEYTKGWKYQLCDPVEIQLKTDIEITKYFGNGYYQAYSGGKIRILAGCCWDGPTWFPDFKWMMKPSLIHDVLHWLIAQGVIPESDNDKIDAELALWIKEGKGKDSKLFNFRAWYVRKATNMVNQKAGDIKKRYQL
tara:strand:- start:548 stop:958 length:411 start_codon:yes stop_codon:yes gene_type:complete